MKFIPTSLPEVLLIEPSVFQDSRGYFFESFNQRALEAKIGRSVNFVQDNHAYSVCGVLRGLHYQIQQPQAKLIRVISGQVFDITVDIRKSSPNFGKYHGTYLSPNTRNMVWVPEGFAHGYYVISESAELLYKASDYWAPEHERCILWNDPDLAIEWPLSGELILSNKDALGKLLREAEVFA